MKYTCMANLSTIIGKETNIPVASVNIGPVTLEFENTREKLQAMYKLLDCTLVQIRYVVIDGQEYTIFFDEEGKTKGKWMATYPLRTDDGEIYDLIPGKFLVVKEDADENILEMTPEEMEAIDRHLHRELDAANNELARIKAEKGV